MTTPVQAADEWCQQLVACGIRATWDPRNVTTPCVLFTPPDEVRMEVGCGGVADMRALALVPAPGNGDAWVNLDGFMPKVLDILPVETLRTVTYQVDDTGPMPAYELSWTQRVDWIC